MKMDFRIILFLSSILILSINGINSINAEIDTLDDIRFLETGLLEIDNNQFQISNKITTREFSNGNIFRVSGITTDGFPYITYSKIIDDKIDTHGIIFIGGEFKKLIFNEKIEEEIINIEKNNELSIVVQYTQRVYAEKLALIDIKIFDPKQNILDDFNQNYGLFSNTDIEVTVLDEENQEFYSINGITNDKGLLEIEFLIPENSIQQTLTVTINAENENSKSSKIFEIFSLGEISDDGKSSS